MRSTGFVIYDTLCALIFYKHLTEACLNLHILIECSQLMGLWSLLHMQAAKIAYLPSLRSKAFNTHIQKVSMLMEALVKVYASKSTR